jgi:hypothetical protein
MTYHDDDEDDETDYSLRDEDDGDTVPCSHCGRDVYDEAEQCPYCGEYITDEGPAARSWPWWMWLGLAGALFVVLWWVVG